MTTGYIPRSKPTQRVRNPNYNGDEPRDDIVNLVWRSLAERSVEHDLSLAHYPRGKARYGLVAAELKSYLVGSLLDVGSRDETLATLTGVPCELVDKNNPALPLFDWDQAQLPYADASFDTVVCLDTLEHLNRPHEALDDLLRVSSRNVVVSLPNCWRKSVKELLVARGHEPSYGLPLEKPKDRHHWYFNSEDALHFLEYRALRSPLGYSVTQVRLHAPARRWWQRLIYPILLHFCPRHFVNLLVRTVFVVLSRR